MARNCSCCHCQKKLPSLLSSQQHFADIFAWEPMILPEIDHVSFLQSMRRHFSPVKFLAADAILLMRKWNNAFLLLAIALAWKWQIASLPEDILWSNDKTIIELGHRKISWFVSVLRINYLPQPSADLFATDKSRYFAQPRPIIANYLPVKNIDKQFRCLLWLPYLLWCPFHPNRFDTQGNSTAVTKFVKLWKVWTQESCHK